MNLLSRCLLVSFLPFCFTSCMNEVQVVALTQSAGGHTIHHNSVFSPDDEWIVFDGRNDDTKIGETSTIGMVHVKTGEERMLYKTNNQTVYGPGVGAASFSPKENTVLFIHGLYDADAVKPYDMTRRFGLAIHTDKPMQGIHMDARDAVSPYRPGSLRGGTHSHCWSNDGQLISFTYNDEFVDPDLRVVGVMIPADKEIVVPVSNGNNNGTYYSAIVSDVVREPKWGSDEISKAFDECWLGGSGQSTIAFQGNTRNEKGETITEIYTVGIDPEMIRKDVSAVGREGERPRVPNGVRQHRLSRTVKGLSDLRHWLRASPDGSFVYALAKDDKGQNQLVQCEVSTGELTYISRFDFSISSPINISYQGDKITFVANNNVYVFWLKSKKLEKLTSNSITDLKIVGVPVFSRKDDKIAFNQFVAEKESEYIQIKLINLVD